MTTSRRTSREAQPRQRTGAVHVPDSLVNRIMRAIVRAGEKTPDGIIFPFGDLPPFLRQAIAERGGRLPPTPPLNIGLFSVTSPATGVAVKVRVSLVAGDRSAGRYTFDLGGEKRTSKEERKDRALKALSSLGLKLPAKKVGELAGMLFTFHESREIILNVPHRPLKSRDLSHLRSVLVHELTHAADEGARRRHGFDKKKMQLLDDIDVISEELGLGEYMPTKRERVEPSPTHGPEWANDPREVTAMINEIATEIGDFDMAMETFRFRMWLEKRPPFKSRERELIAFLRWKSPTFLDVSSEWEPKNLNRVLRSIWDRYHAKKEFPKATGVLINRRTSRRGTIRRRTSRRGRS